MDRRRFFMLIVTSIALSTLLLTPATTALYPPVDEYDSFADISSPDNIGYPDGKIDLWDLMFLAIKYGTEGNPQRNVTFLDTMDVNVTNWPDWTTASSQPSWIKYIAQHNALGSIYDTNQILVPHGQLGQIGPDILPRSVGIGDFVLFHVYHSLGEVDLRIAGGREVIGQLVLSSAATAAHFLRNVTMEFGFTDMVTYTPLVSGTWAGDRGTSYSASGYTVEMGSLASDFEISGKYIYFSLYIMVHSTSAGNFNMYFQSGSRDHICVLIPQS